MPCDVFTQPSESPPGGEPREVHAAAHVHGPSHGSDKPDGTVWQSDPDPVVNRSAWATTRPGGADGVGPQAQGSQSTRLHGPAGSHRKEAAVGRRNGPPSRLRQGYANGIAGQHTGRGTHVAEVQHRDRVPARTIHAALAPGPEPNVEIASRTRAGMTEGHGGRCCRRCPVCLGHRPRGCLRSRARIVLATVDTEQDEEHRSRKSTTHRSPFRHEQYGPRRPVMACKSGICDGADVPLSARNCPPPERVDCPEPVECECHHVV